MYCVFLVHALLCRCVCHKLTYSAGVECEDIPIIAIGDEKHGIGIGPFVPITGLQVCDEQRAVCRLLHGEYEWGVKEGGGLIIAV